MLRTLLRHLLAAPTPAPASAPPPTPARVPAPVTPPKSAMEVVVEHAERMRSELRKVEQREYLDHKAAVADAEAHIAAAIKWIERTGLAAALPPIIDALRPWAAWIKRDDFHRWVPPDVYDITAEERTESKEGYTSPRRTWHVTYSLAPGATRYGFEFVEEPGGFEGTSFGEAHVYHGEQEVFRIACMTRNRARDWETRWSTGQPSVLVPGEWVAAVLALEHRIRLHRDRSQRQRDAETLAERAAGLPDPGVLHD